VDEYVAVRLRFSALQRAENSSIFRKDTSHFLPPVVSVLFSEPKIPQSRDTRRG